MCIYRETGSDTPAGNMLLHEFNTAFVMDRESIQEDTNISAAHSLKQYFQQTLDIGIVNVKQGRLHHF